MKQKTKKKKKLIRIEKRTSETFEENIIKKHMCLDIEQEEQEEKA